MEEFESDDRQTQQMTPPPQLLQLPIEGVLALETVLGIMTDNDIPLDRDTGIALTEKLYWASQQDAPELELSILEADTLLRGLAYTEEMSADFPWYPMVIDTVHYVGGELLGLWPTDTWIAYRSNQTLA